MSNNRASTPINRLPRQSKVNLSDLLVLWANTNQATRNVAISQFIDDLNIVTGENSRATKDLYGITQVNANYIVDIASILTEELLVCDASGAAFSISLPALTDLQVGEWISIKKADTTANQITVIPSGADTIDGDPNLTLNGVNMPSVKLINDGFKWVVINA